MPDSLEFGKKMGGETMVARWCRKGILRSGGDQRGSNGGAGFRGMDCLRKTTNERRDITE